jgi:hypothetical protein
VSRRGGARRARALGAIALLAALLARAPVAAAGRPYDAPVAPVAAGNLRPRAAVPEVTPEYASIEEAGVRLVYHPLARERAHTLLARALAIRAELTAQLGRDVLGEVQIRVAAAPAQMTGLSPMDVPSGAPAVVFRDQRLVVMSLASPIAGEPPDLGDRLRHELAHLALDEAIAGHDVPRWFHEGYALHFSGEEAPQRAETLCVAALYDRLIGLRDVDASFPDGAPMAAPSIAAAEAADFVRFLRERPGRDRFSALIERLRAGAPFERALPEAYETDLDRIELGWRKEMARRYSFVPVFAGATLLWVVIAAGVVLRRRRHDAERRAAARPFAAAARLSLHELAEPPASAEDDEIARAMPPEPEVPRVEHGGRWYTLH